MSNSITQQLAERRARLANQSNHNKPTNNNTHSHNNHYTDDLQYARQLQTQFDAENTNHNNSNHHQQLLDNDHKMALQLQQEMTALDQHSSHYPNSNNIPSLPSFQNTNNDNIDHMHESYYSDSEKDTKPNLFDDPNFINAINRQIETNSVKIKPSNFMNNTNRHIEYNTNCDLQTQHFSDDMVKEQKYDDNPNITIVTWNINENDHFVSASTGWKQYGNKMRCIYQQTIQQNPDIIILQEIPSMSCSLLSYFRSDRWYISNAKKSHCGFIVCIINKDLETKRGFKVDLNTISDIYEETLPALILLKNDVKKLVFFGVHLPPFNRSKDVSDRRNEFNKLVNIADAMGMVHNFIIVGDTNMRQNEENKILKDYKGEIKSCWDVVSKNKKKKMYTWYMNYFEVGCPAKSRFDKLFYGSKLKCLSVEIFDKPVDGNPQHYLSDHRAMCCVVQI